MAYFTRRLIKAATLPNKPSSIGNVRVEPEASTQVVSTVCLVVEMPPLKVKSIFLEFLVTVPLPLSVSRPGRQIEAASLASSSWQ